MALRDAFLTGTPIFVLETNHPDLSAAEVVQSYRQLMEVERAFRVLKSLVKVRPVYRA
jgi:transposase